jgi:hypothetical protein
MDEILPYTMMSIREHIPTPPHYATIHTRTDVEHIRHCLPSYLQGTHGIVMRIQEFLGYGFKWVCIHANLAAMHTHRHRDAYFVYSVFSRRLALPQTVSDLVRGTHACAHGYLRMHTYVDTAARCLPLGRPGLFYTRTGHMGTSKELAAVCRLVRCPGRVVAGHHQFSRTGRHLVVTSEHCPSVWPAHVCVRTASTLGPDEYATHWDTVVLFHLPGADTTQYGTFPDARHLSGCIDTVWADVHHSLPHRSHTVICTGEVLSEARLLTYLHVLGVCYHGILLVPRQFVLGTFLLIRVTETLLLNGLV